MILNKIKQEGNSIFIRSNPVTGIVALTSFVDDASGENVNHNFTKQFRYSLNGIIFTDWLALTVQNILAIPVLTNNVFVIELQYTKNPVGDTSINVGSATIGTTAATQTETNLFKNSIFYQFFGSGDTEVLGWMLNVLEKLFDKGLLPNYIDRYNDFGSPNDFIEFWGSICKFFAYYVVYARKYQMFYESETLLSEYLEERGLKTAKDNTLVQLQELMKHYYREVARRGTVHIVDNTDGVNKLFDGELLRLINHQAQDEFLFNPNKPEHCGWNINNASPMYRSVSAHDNLNKLWEKSVEPSDITKWPSLGGGNLTIVTDNGKNVLNINGAGGIGSVASQYAIPVDPRMDYELSFYIKKDAGLTLNVGFAVMDKNFAPAGLLKMKDGTSPDSMFIVNADLQRSDKYLYLRFFVYNKLKPLNASDTVNMKFTDAVAYLTPYIEITSDTANLYNIRFVPMALPYSKGFVQANNFIDCILKNNNHQYTIGEIDQYIKKYLLPYNATFKITETEKAGDYS